MPITIGPNIASLRASRLLNRSSDALATTFQRLSSGLRINRAADDPAGLAIASSLEANSRIYTQGIKNLNDGLSVLSVAQSGLESMGTIVTRLQELATQASNGVLSTNQRSAIQTESNALVNEYNRIASSTTFNGNAVLDPTNGANYFIFQGGAGDANTTAVTIGSAIDYKAGTGTFANATSFAVSTGQIVGNLSADLNGDGKADLIVGGSTSWILIGNGDGTFSRGLSFGATYNPSVGDVNHDGKLDLVYNPQNSQTVVRLGNGDGTFAAANTYSSSGGKNLGLDYTSLSDINNDGNPDFISSSWWGQVGISLGNADGSFSKSTTIDVVNNGINSVGEGNTLAADVNNDGKADLITMATSLNKYFISIGNGDGTFKAANSYSSNGVSGPRWFNTADFNGDGKTDMVITNLFSLANTVFLGNGDGTFKIAVSYSIGTVWAGSYPEGNVAIDLNGDGFTDIFSFANDAPKGYVVLGNGDGTFRARQDASAINLASTPGNPATADLNGDGVPDIFGGMGSNNMEILIQNTVSKAWIKNVNLSSQASAQQALTYLSNQQSLISQELGNVGAYQSRIGFQINNLAAQKLEYDNAYSRIMTADIATESAELVKQSVLRNAATGILAQANQQPFLVLKLLDFS